MKELPILYGTPMVQANLAGRKRMTRRTRGLEKINENPDEWVFRQWIAEVQKPISTESDWRLYAEFGNDELGICRLAKASYNVGDHVWVRETHFDTRPYKTAPLFANSPDFLYRADKDFIGCHKWKPSLFMKKEAARLWLEIIRVSCERLQSITHDDAIDEGIKFVHGTDFTRYFDYVEKEYTLRYPTHSFFSLWRSINGKDSVAANPWVFVYEYKIIDKIWTEYDYTYTYEEKGKPVEYKGTCKTTTKNHKEIVEREMESFFLFCKENKVKPIQCQTNIKP